VVLEPGRSIVADAGITLYRVGSVKEIPNIRTYVAVDGGMADNPRPALYQSKYTAALANRMNDAPDGVYTLAGRCCESGDILITDAPLPKPQVGDLVAVFVTGAYNASMSSVYNRLAHPAMVLVNNGKTHVIQARQSLSALIAQDRSLSEYLYQ